MGMIVEDVSETLFTEIPYVQAGIPVTEDFRHGGGHDDISKVTEPGDQDGAEDFSVQ
jgi:hypothetical protein